MSYTKYYKKKDWEFIRTKDLKPYLQKLLPKKCFSVWTTFDLKRNKIVFEDLTDKSFSKMIRGEDNRNVFKKCIDRFFHFLQWRCKITFRANRKALQTLMIKHLGILALTKEDSNIYKESWHKYTILYGVINSKGIRQPVMIFDNVCHTDDFTYFISHIGMQDKAKEIWDIWMKSKYTNKDRKKFRKAVEKELIAMIEIIK